MFDMQVIVRHLEVAHSASITLHIMMRPDRAKVIFDHPHNANGRSSARGDVIRSGGAQLV
jgi:hypothetical protein